MGNSAPNILPDVFYWEEADRIQISLPIRAMGKPRLNRSDSWKKRDGKFRRACVQAWYDYKDLIREKCKEVLPLLQKTREIEIRAGFAMPASWSAKKRARMRGLYHDAKPDVDNIAKGILDTLMEQDQKVGALTVQKFWADEYSLEIDCWIGGFDR